MSPGRALSGELASIRSLQSAAVNSHHPHSRPLGTCRAGSSETTRRIIPATCPLNSSSMASAPIRTSQPSAYATHPSILALRQRPWLDTGRRYMYSFTWISSAALGLPVLTS